MSLKVQVPAYFPAGRPCGGFGKPTHLVGLYMTDTATQPAEEGPGAGRVRLCGRCAEAVQYQAKLNNIRCLVEPMGI